MCGRGKCTGEEEVGGEAINLKFVQSLLTDRYRYYCAWIYIYVKLLVFRLQISELVIVGLYVMHSGIISNDSVILESLHTVRINTSLDDAPDILCYQVSGRANQAFNLVSDLCVNVNAYYSPMNRPVLGNIMSEIGVRAATDDNRCYNIRVARDQCQAFVQGPDSVEVLLGENMMIGGLSVRLYSDRVRISAPNCRQVTLVMWIICDTSGKQDFLHFVISRGINLRPTSHGLLGKT